MANIRIKRGDNRILTINTVDCEGTLVDASGWTIYFTVRLAIPATSVVTDNDAIISKTITGLSTGVHTMELTKTDTNIDPKKYVFDFQINKADGSPYSSETGIFIIQADITRTP